MTEPVSGWLQSGVRIHILNMGMIDDTPAGRLILNIMLSFAEFEKDMITERTQEGRALAKTKPGFREGWPLKYAKEQTGYAVQLPETYSYTKVEEMTGISRNTLLRERRKRGLAGFSYLTVFLRIAKMRFAAFFP